MLTCECLCFNQYHQLFPSIPSLNGVSFVCVNFATLIFSCCRLIDSLHSYIFKFHLTIATSFSSINTPIGPIFLDRVYPFKWSISELKIMFHDILAFLKKHVLLLTSIIISNASFVHMPFLLAIGI
jgi:hypothetical protein